MGERKYEDYYVAFLDILGFKDLLSTNSSCDEICSVFDCLHDHSRWGITVDDKTIESFNNVQSYIMSDSIVLYIKSDITDSFFALLGTCLHLQMRLIDRENPVLIRGGITRGELFVAKDVIFGKGLSAAYQLESSVSSTPRIVFSQQLLSEGTSGSEFLKTLPLDKLMYLYDDDELCYVHYLSMVYYQPINDFPAFLDKILTLCKGHLDVTFDKSLRNKYIWLKRYALYVIDSNRKVIQNFSNAEEYLKKWDIQRRLL